MARAACSVTYPQQGKATTEERMGRVGDLYLGVFFFRWVLEVGTKLMARTTPPSTTTGFC
jgi:hypothetical protein